MLPTSDLDYDLPEEFIATQPVRPRDAARLLVASPGSIAVEHASVRDLPRYLRPGDLLISNSTRVIPARFLGRRTDTPGRVEGLFLSEAGPGRWQVLLKMRRMKPGVVVSLHDHDGRDSGVCLRLIERSGGGDGWVVQVEGDGGALERIGLTPLPPYILAARKRHHVEVADESDREAYQTVFARRGEVGSVAAPTAGLHFTPELLSSLEAAGVRRAEVILHVGMGTFKPVETEFVEQHPMHAEWCCVPRETAEAISRTRQAGGRVIAIGTTAARTLESFESVEEMIASGSKQTRLLITPGYSFRHTDGLLTNFHLPRSTLMALVAALLPGGVARLKALYALAVREGYRFYSYGDAMLILPGEHHAKCIGVIRATPIA